MALSRIYERDELSPGLQRVLDGTRESLDLPFVPTLFKLLAGTPEYLKLVWDDLGPVLRSKEFHIATKALTEQVRTIVLEGGWRFPDQAEVLATQNLSGTELALFSGISGTFARALPQMLLVARLLQRGYSGGQRGNVTEISPRSALSQLIEFHIPNERQGGLRVWLIYTDVRRRTGAAAMPSVYRMLSAYPGYLASVWLESKRLIEQPAVKDAIDTLGARAGALITGLPVRDHRIAAKLSPEQWRNIEETVDETTRTLPLFALTTMIWHRSFPAFARIATAA